MPTGTAFVALSAISSRVRATIRSIGLIAVGALGLGASEPAQVVNFHEDVVPVLNQHCAKCHSGEKSKGGFSFNTRELMLDAKAAIPGNSAKSMMIELVLDDDPEFQMPPEDKPRLNKDEIKILRQWIDQGLEWEEGFTFAGNRYEAPLKPRRVELPSGQQGRDHAIDRIIDAYLVDNKVTAQPMLDDAAYYRRVSLDLLGLLPDADDLDRFVRSSEPNKHEQLVDELLANDLEYARHWLSFWSDLLRNDYAGPGYIEKGRASIANWLYRSLMENKTFDAMTRELLAPKGDSAGFIRGIKWRGDVNASQTPEIQFAQNVGQVFLGINLKCASCHDSFIDRWTLEEAYGLAAVFSEKPLELNRCDKPTGEMAKPSWIFPELGAVDPKAERDERLKQLAALMTSPDNGRLTRTTVNRFWHLLMGRGIVYPVDAMQTEPWSEDLLDYLAVYFSDNEHDLKKLMRHIVTSQAYRSRAVVLKDEPKADEYMFQGPLVKRMTAEQFVDTIRQVTENPRTAKKFKRFAPQKVEKDNGVDTKGVVRSSMLTSDLLQRALGRPNRTQVVTSRPQALTTLQALDLANGEALAGLISRGAGTLMKAHAEFTGEQFIELVFRRALSRRPTAPELSVCKSLIGETVTKPGLEDVLWSVFMLPEFQHVR